MRNQQIIRVLLHYLSQVMNTWFWLHLIGIELRVKSWYDVIELFFCLFGDKINIDFESKKALLINEVLTRIDNPSALVVVVCQLVH